MAQYLRPGVYVQETLNPTPQTVGLNSTSVAAFVGVNDRGPTSTPVLVSSWSQYTTLFGTWNSVASNNLPLAVYQFFANGGSQCYVTRAIHSGSAAASATVNDRTSSGGAATLVIKAVNPGTWGNNINVTIQNSAGLVGYFDLIVYYGGTADANVVERFPGISMTASNARYALSVVNGTSNYITLLEATPPSTATGITRNPVVGVNQPLSSGNDGTAPTSTDISNAISLLDIVQSALILNVPGYTDQTTVNAALSYAIGRGDCFVIIDGINDTVTNQTNLAANYTATSYGAVYYPPLTIPDPTVGLGGNQAATVLVGPGASVAALYTKTDSSRGVFKAPAGLQARLTGVVSVVPLTNASLDALNSAVAPVNAIRFVSGSGIVVMGARTLQPGYATIYVPVRRSLIYLEKSLTDLTKFAIFEPNDQALWRRLNATVSTFLTSFWSQGGLSGATPDQAFFVQVDSSNNTPLTIANGEVHITVGVALQRPAEFVVIKIGQYDGGTTVTVA
jgi:hypothetical protein